MTHTISPVAGKPRYGLLLFAVIGILVVLYFLAASAGFEAVQLKSLFASLSFPHVGHDTSTSGGGRSGSRCPGPVEDSDDADRADCQPILRGFKNWSTPARRTVITQATYVARAQKCDCFRSDFGYFVSSKDISEEERQFPIAFSLLTYENLEQTERLLRLIYRPHNVYCIHVDAKSPVELRQGLEAIAKCLDNVFVAYPPVSVLWGNISVVNAELVCIRQLLQHDERWKYFINLVGRDMPLRTNRELVQILTAYNGSNDVEGSRKVTE